MSQWSVAPSHTLGWFHCHVGFVEGKGSAGFSKVPKTMRSRLRTFLILCLDIPHLLFLSSSIVEGTTDPWYVCCGTFLTLRWGSLLTSTVWCHHGIEVHSHLSANPTDGSSHLLVYWQIGRQTTSTFVLRHCLLWTLWSSLLTVCSGRPSAAGSFCRLQALNCLSSALLLLSIAGRSVHCAHGSRALWGWERRGQPFLATVLHQIAESLLPDLPVTSRTLAQGWKEERGLTLPCSSPSAFCLCYWLPPEPVGSAKRVAWESRPLGDCSISIWWHSHLTLPPSFWVWKRIKSPPADFKTLRTPSFYKCACVRVCMYVSMSMWWCVHMSARVSRSRSHPFPLEPQLQVVVGHLIWAPGTELRSSLRVFCALNHRALSLAHEYYIFYFLLCS